MIIHILRDGTVVPDIAGHIVKVEDCESIYSLVEHMNARKERRTQNGKND